MITCQKCGKNNFFKPGDDIKCQCGQDLDNRKDTTRFNPPIVSGRTELSDEIADKEIGSYQGYFNSETY